VRPIATRQLVALVLLICVEFGAMWFMFAQRTGWRVWLAPVVMVGAVVVFFWWLSRQLRGGGST